MPIGCGLWQEVWRSWLSINDSWTSKWWYAAVHNITAVIGAGVLSLHAAMVDLSWAPGIFVLCVIGVISLSTMWQMIELHELDGKRMDRYHELGQRAFGKKLGLWIVVPMQMLVEIGVDTVYLLTAGKSIRKIHSLLYGCPIQDSSCNWELRYCIMAFASVQLLLSQLPHFTSITWVSIIAAFMSLGYSTIAWVATLMRERSPTVSYEFPKATSTADVIFRVFSSLGQISFAFAGHNIVLEIQATIPSTIERPSKISAWNGALLAYTMTILCYFPNALVGYYVFGNQKNHDMHVLEILDKPVWLVALGNAMVVTHMCGGFQIFAMPLFDNVEMLLTNLWKVNGGINLRLLVRSIYVAFTCFLAVTFPFFDDLLAFVGGIAFVPTTFLLPCIIWQILRKPRTLGLPWLANMACIGVGFFLTIASTAGGLRNILLKASHYQFYK
ncbi:lysine histidine transporter 2 [Selaginella moellendorffii]|nr:lysine histidine transporter 2 [Selaginella moellendorffii]|eukprot:XP_002960942.2 lysine histidine transporter 2 [Selaginella moellendorffii]